LKGTLKFIWFQPPCHEQGHLPLDQVAQSSIHHKSRKRGETTTLAKRQVNGHWNQWPSHVTGTSHGWEVDPVVELSPASV